MKFDTVRAPTHWATMAAAAWPEWPVSYGL